MAKRPLILVLLFGLVFQVGARAQAPEPETAPQPTEPPSEAMAWDRDFDLLLELSKVPTKDQLSQEDRRKALAQEREEVWARLTDLKARLTLVEGTYTTEALLNEMLRQGVGDVLTAQDNLRKWIHRDENRIKEIDLQLKRLAAERGN